MSLASFLDVSDVIDPQTLTQALNLLGISTVIGGLVNAATRVRKKTWEDTDLAKILGAGNQNFLLEMLHIDFITRMDDLKWRKKDYKIQKKDVSHLNLLIYSGTLMRINDVLAQKNVLLKQKQTSLEALLIKEDIKKLNKAFSRYILKYEKVFSPRTTIWEVIGNHIESFIPSETGNTHLCSPDYFRKKKIYADMGYVMSNEINKLLSIDNFNPDEGVFSVIKGHISHFLKWMETHPRRASELAGDVALTCSILEDETFLRTFCQTITVRNYSNAFLSALGLFQEYEPIEPEEMMKFRALADLTQYAPWLAAFIQVSNKAINRDYHSIVHLLIDIGRKTYTINITRKIAELIPSGQENLVALAIDVIRGNELQQVICRQRNLALISLAGSVREIFKSSENPYESIKREAAIWWNSIWMSTGSERHVRIAVQLALPAIGAATATALVVASVAISLFSMMAALSLASSCIVCALFLSKALTVGLDFWYNTRTRVMEVLLKRQKEKELNEAWLFIENNPESKEKIQEQAVLFIRDLKNKYSLPHVSIPEINDDETKQLVEEYALFYGNALDEKVASRMMSPEECVQLFNELINPNRIRENLGLVSTGPQHLDTLTFAIVNNLIDGWLTKQLEVAFKTRFLSLYHKSREEYLDGLDGEQRSLSVNDYLAKKIKVDETFKTALVRQGVL